MIRNRLFGSVLAALFVTGFLFAEPAKTGTGAKKIDPEAMKKLCAPGEEHKKLEPFVGEFTFTGKCFMDPSKPTETKGTSSRKWILGNRFVEDTIDGVVGTEKFQAKSVLGYDNCTKKFTNGFICNMCTCMSCATGKVDASGKEFTFEGESYCPMQGKMVKTRSVSKIVDDKKQTYTSFMDVNGKDVKTLELTIIRK